MDPNEALRLVREAAGEIRHADDDDTLEGSQVGQLVEAFEALDEWLSREGFLPEAWGKPRCHHKPGPNQPGSHGETDETGRMALG